MCRIPAAENGDMFVDMVVNTQSGFREAAKTKMPLEGKLIRRRQDATIVTKKSENDSAASVGKVDDWIRPNC